LRASRGVAGVALGFAARGCSPASAAARQGSLPGKLTPAGPADVASAGAVAVATPQQAPTGAFLPSGRASTVGGGAARCG
jgi:hypothetical protein